MQRCKVSCKVGRDKWTDCEQDLAGGVALENLNARLNVTQREF